MIKRTFLISGLLLCTTACVQQVVPVSKQQFDQAMVSQLNYVESLITSECLAESEKVEAQAQHRQAMVKRFQRIETNIETLSDKIERPPVICAEVPPSPLGNKMILGEVERVYINEVGHSFEARVDTGAGYSSISAANIEAFERNGVEWVRFDIPSENPEEPIATLEGERVRYVSIKKAGNTTEADRRPVINVQIKLGDFVTETEFNLTDRSHLEYPVLLGRRFFKDIAVVDVSRRFIQSAKEHSRTTK